ncbi:hypothetical protein VTJ04DRAFT_7254 [Mycothermus thermophilus]|uniref:uncharacterized protein n=1 Tax=Humicola insolens TaxID=85995 RepID=UPI0037448593
MAQYPTFNDFDQNKTKQNKTKCLQRHPSLRSGRYPFHPIPLLNWSRKKSKHGCWVGKVIVQFVNRRRRQKHNQSSPPTPHPLSPSSLPHPPPPGDGRSLIIAVIIGVITIS